MTDLLPILAAASAGLAIGAALVLWLKSRKTSTKAELLYALAFEAKQIAKMPGAAEAIEHANQQAASEALAQANLVAALQKAANAPLQP